MALNRTDVNMAQRVESWFGDKDPQDPNGKTWLTANEIMQKTGISKNDLVRFIQLKTLPKSMMRVMPSGPDKTRRNSYFSASILGHVAMLKLLRDEGHSVETIAAELGPAEDAPAQTREQALPETKRTLDPPDANRGKHSPPDFHLPANAIATSALFVDHGLRIGWINVVPGDCLTSAIQDEVNDNPSGSIFEILLRASLKELVFNWQPLFAFIYGFLKATTAAETFNRMAPTISIHLEDMDTRGESSDDLVRQGPIDSYPIRLGDNAGRMQAMRIYGISLSEGALFILNEERCQDGAVSDMTGEAEPTAETEAVEKTAFSVLSARLDDSRSIVDTLLPETYFEIMTRIWEASDQVMAAYGGHRAKRSGTEVQYIIPRRGHTDPAFDAICCAIELRDKMREIDASMKTDDGWFADIRLNIGISSGKDHLQPEDPTASMAFLLPGGAADQAFHLSAIAHEGAIWITKSAFGHLTPQQIKRITFGVFRDDKLIRNIFAPISELPQIPGTPLPGRGIRSLSVTRIIELRPE